MSVLRFLTAGESHGPCLLGIVEGLPAGLPITEEQVAGDLARRQIGYGRGGRMKIERDWAEILSGVVAGLSTGAPVSLRIENRDWPNWKDRVLPKITVPRPGHADLAGALKYGYDDMRLVLERASARETAMRVAVGSLAKTLIAQCGTRVYSHVISIGPVRATTPELPPAKIHALAELSPVRCADSEAAKAMCAEIDLVQAERDTLGGVFEVIVTGVPIGLGSHVQWDRRLSGRLAHAVMSIPAIKGVEIGDGFAVAGERGTAVHDELFVSESGPERWTNRAGGLEGGISNGGHILVRAAMKPISTTLRPLRTIDLATGKDTTSQYQRSDFCAVPAASVVAEAMVAWVLAEAVLEKFGGDSVRELNANVANYLSTL